MTRNTKLKPLRFKPNSIRGISKKNLDIHYGKLYLGYVNKANEIWEELTKFRSKIFSDKESGNQTYSKLRALKQGETFAVNGMYLHEWYFGLLGGHGNPKEAPELSKAIRAKWGSVENGIKYLNECAMSARGWTVLAWDIKKGKLMQYNADAHNQGGVWGCVPIIVIDVYEHAYFMDFGADRKAYLEVFWKNFNWKEAEEIYKKFKDIKF